MPELTPKLGIKKPLGNETVSRAAFNENWDIIDQNTIADKGGVPSIQAGPDASKPAAGTAGRLYVATDTQIIYRDTGTAWQKVGAVKWEDIDGKPSSFTPSAHKSTHATGGTDTLTPGDIGAASAADLAAHLADTVQAHKVYFGSANFAGPAGVTITHNIGHTNYKVMITPTADPGGFLGEIWVVKSANTIVVYNSGSATTAFDWQIAEVTA